MTAAKYTVKTLSVGKLLHVWGAMFCLLPVLSLVNG
jgi:hypothetical protein